MKASYASILLFCFIVSICYADTIISEGDVSGTWSVSGSPYMINGNITVPVNETLDIQAGTQIIFNGYYRVDIYGIITAAGTVNDSISFTVADTTGFSNISDSTGAWDGLHFHNTNDDQSTSIFSYCKFSYGKAIGDSLTGNGGAVYSDNYSNIHFDHCRFSNNTASYAGGSICSINSAMSIVSCFFEMNRAHKGGAIYGSENHSGVEDSDFRNNDADYGGALYFNAIDVSWGNFNIFSSTFFQNQAEVSGGAIYANGGLDLAQCRIFNNRAMGSSPDGTIAGGGGIFAAFASLYLATTIIANNEATNGGGILSANSVLIYNISNLTLCNNAADNGGGLYFLTGGGNDFLQDMIISGNQANLEGYQIYLQETNVSSTDPSMSNCLITGGLEGFGGNGSGTSYNPLLCENIYTFEPMFVNPTPGAGINFDASLADWSLQPMSPCIDAGIDFPDVDGTYSDLGAIPYYQTIIPVHITEDTTWDMPVVRLFQQITIDENATLTINPGTRVIIVANDIVIQVKGSITALGTPDQPIIFEVRDTTNFFSRNNRGIRNQRNANWQGFDYTQVNAQSDSSIFLNCRFKYAKKDNGAFFEITNFNKIRFQNCLFIHGIATNIGGAIYGVNSHVKIENCQFVDCRTSGNSTYAGAIFLNTNSTAFIISSEFLDCKMDSTSHQFGGGALYLANNSSATIWYSSFNRCSGFLGGAIYLDTNAGLNLQNCSFIGNLATVGGAIHCSNNSNLMIGNSVFGFNQADIGGALSLSSTNDIQITNTRFISNEAQYVNALSPTELRGGGAISAKQVYDFNIKNCLFYNNQTDKLGGMSLLTFTEANFYNNTIVGNRATTGGGLFLSGSSPVFIDNIIWNNLAAESGDQVFINSFNTNPQFRYNDIQGGLEAITNNIWVGLYSDCIDANPGFTAIDGFEWALSETSPCVNAGIEDISNLDLPPTDLLGNQRFFDERIDMGCYELNVVGNDDHVAAAVKPGLICYPNPVLLPQNQHLNIVFQLSDKAAKVPDVAIYNIKGQLVKRFLDTDMEKRNSSCSLKWDFTNSFKNTIASGVYILILNDNGVTHHSKIVVIK